MPCSGSEAGAWGGTDAGPIMRKIFDAWVVAKGGAAPRDVPLPAPGESNQGVPDQSAPNESTAPIEDIPVEDAPAQASSSDGATQ